MNNKFKLVSESVIFSSDNILYNFDEWVKSDKGKLLITGYTGSGKSTLAKELGNKYKVKIIELDSYIDIDENKVKILKEKNKINELRNYFQKQTNKSINELLNKKEKLIIEGIQIFIYDKPNNYKKHSIIITGTSALFSFFRALKRNRGEDFSKEWTIFEIIDDIYHNLFIKKVENFIKLINGWNNE